MDMITTPEATQWAQPLTAIASRGSQAKRPGSLAGLHEARRAHASQFFTSPELAAWLWRLIAPVLASSPRPLTVLDNSAGVGRLFWPADPERVRIHAVDLDGDALGAFAKVAEDAGFRITAINAALQDVSPGCADVALINPPFGLMLQGEFLEPFPGITTWGDAGPLTAAPSIPYAIAQAMQACPLVLSIVPETFDAALYPTLATRHVMTLSLPVGLFREEGTDVRVKALVFGPEWVEPLDTVPEVRITDLSAPPPALPDVCINQRVSPSPPFVLGREATRSSITTPVTGNCRVRVAHDGRKLLLGFSCGLVEAKVRNGLLRQHVFSDEHHRLPPGVHFEGQGWLDLENILAAPSPLDTLDQLQTLIRGLGGEPAVDPGLIGYLRRRIRRDALQRVPFRRWIQADGVADLASQPEGQPLPATAKRAHVSNPKVWGSPVIRPSDVLAIVPRVGERGREYAVQRAGDVLRVLTAEQVNADYQVSLPKTTGWHLLHPGRATAFPELAHQRLRRLVEVGAKPWLESWGFQLTDAVELTMADRGCAAWSMGLGKTRLALSIALTGGACNLIVVDAHLLPEFEEEIAKLGLPDDLWQIIERPDQLDTLKRINLISYSRLRMPVAEGAGRRTYASRLRRCIHTLVADEGHKVRNRDSEQTRALWMVSPKRRYAMTGTPAANYPRDSFQLLCWVIGDALSHQPYGNYHPYIAPSSLVSMRHAQRGVEVFKDRHVTLEWSVRTFDEDLKTGAKREVPKLRGVEQFRQTLSTLMLRRVPAEPEVAAHIRIPVPERYTHTIDWDMPHLSAYVTTAERFIDWFREARERAGEKGQNVNLIALLARIGAVFSAANVPSRLAHPLPAYHVHTSKDRKAIGLVKQFTSDGRQTVLYATSPDTLIRLGRELDALGIGHVRYDGTTPIGPRTRQLRRWKRGEMPVLLATYGAAQVGLNLPQGSRVIAYNRMWTVTEEEQAFARVLRPQQQRDVEIHYLHLLGSIDTYMQQLVDFKRDALGAGIDYDDALLLDEDFLHLDEVLWRFCENLAEDLGYPTTHALKEALVLH